MSTLLLPLGFRTLGAEHLVKPEPVAFLGYFSLGHVWCAFFMRRSAQRHSDFAFLLLLVSFIVLALPLCQVQLLRVLGSCFLPPPFLLLLFPPSFWMQCGTGSHDFTPQQPVAALPCPGHLG